MTEEYQEIENSRLIKGILENACRHEMEQFTENAPFEHHNDLLVYLISCAIPEDYSPEKMAKDWGISFDAATWIMSSLVANMLMPNTEDSEEVEEAT